MSYTPHTWQTGETVTAEKLNAMEQGIAGGGSMVITLTKETDTPQPGWITVTMDKTWQQIHDAIAAGMRVIRVDGDDNSSYQYVIDNCYFDGTSYNVEDGDFTTDSPNGYPSDSYNDSPLN